jgi:predicted GNAT family N-acyltransferase
MKIHVEIASKNPEKVLHARSVRENVFQKEQGVSQQIDFDAEDATATHFIAYYDGRPVGTARIRFPYAPTQAKLERFAVLSEMRGKKIGELILKKIEEHVLTMKVAEIVLNSELEAKGFYEKYGYATIGEVYEEVNIPHIKMKKVFK